MRACAFCPNGIQPHEDHYRDHDGRLVCKSCYRKWQERRDG